MDYSYIMLIAAGVYAVISLIMLPFQAKATSDFYKQVAQDMK